MDCLEWLELAIWPPLPFWVASFTMPELRPSLKFLWGVYYLAMEDPAPSTTYRQGKGPWKLILTVEMIDAASIGIRFGNYVVEQEHLIGTYVL